MCQLGISTDLQQTLQTTTRTEPSLTPPFSQFLSSVKGSTIQLPAQARKLGFTPDFSQSPTWGETRCSVLSSLPPESRCLPLSTYYPPMNVPTDHCNSLTGSPASSQTPIFILHSSNRVRVLFQNCKRGHLLMPLKIFNGSGAPRWLSQLRI